MLRTLIIATLGITIATLPVQAQTLYDGSKNTLPPAPGWSTVLLPGATQTVSNGGTTLNTTASDQLRAGYGWTSSPLDRVRGYTLGFNVQLLSEAHQSPDRAGFSLIALSSDLRGIELGFWTNDTRTRDHIWAQNTGFTHAEGTAFNPSALTRYDLSVKGDQYNLFASGNRILTGNLRNYSLGGSRSALERLIYTQRNFIFLGDNTTSARGSVRITRVDLSPTVIPVSSVNRSARMSVTSVPEPMTMLGTGMAIAFTGLLHRKRKK